MKFMLKQKIIGLACLAALLPVAAMVALTLFLEPRTAESIDEELGTLAEENVAQITRDVYALCEMTHELLSRQLERANVAASLNIIMAGNINKLEGYDRWQARNIYEEHNHEEGEEEHDATINVMAPRLALGETPFGMNRDGFASTPLVDEIQELSNVECSVFVRVKQEGDMLCIASSTKNDVLERFHVGEYHPVYNDEGEIVAPHIAAVLNGEVFQGFVGHGEGASLALYSPINDTDGDVMGMVVLSIELESTETLRNTIMDIKVGETGYVWVLGGPGPHLGHYIISLNGERDGEDIWEVTDAVDPDNLFVQKMITGSVAAYEAAEAARQAKAAEILTAGGTAEEAEAAQKEIEIEMTFEEYPWLNEGEEEPRLKLSAVLYFKPWNWVIGAGTYEDEYYKVKAKVRDELGKLRVDLMWAGAIVLVLVVIMAYFMGWILSRPLGHISNVAQRIAQGDLHGASKHLDESAKTIALAKKGVRFEDETSQLVASFGAMTGNLNNLVGQVQRAGIQVNTTATEIAAQARQLEATVTEQATSANEVTASSQEIAATSKELSSTMGGVAQIAAETAQLAGEGRQGLVGLRKAINGLMRATTSISDKLDEINVKAEGISGVVTAITAVADQTNLLSLNAAIEAEKAGEYGLGFSVVADEIRRLADQTAVATLDIEKCPPTLGAGGRGDEVEPTTGLEPVTSSLPRTCSTC